MFVYDQSMTDETAPARTLELSVRSLSASATGCRGADILDQLDQLTAASRIREYTVTIWGKRISTAPAISRTDSGSGIRTQIAAFKQWANEHGASLEGDFTTRTIYSSITGDTHAFITLPSLALAARREGYLDWVSPSSQEDEPIMTVRDKLASITRHDAESHAPL